MKKRIVCFLILFALLSPMASAAAADEDSLSMADSLYTMGLFRGTGVGYELDRRLSRAEGVVMLVRFLGKESIALSGVWKHPFSDVPAWADQYVGYAYQAGLTLGVGGTLFGGGLTDYADANQYAVFLLRALDYSESAGDFTYSGASGFVGSIGLTAGESGSGAEFLRGDAAALSYRALTMSKKGGGLSLIQSLVDAGAVSGAKAKAAGLSAWLSDSAEKSAMDAEDLFDLCSPAVFYLTTYDSDGDPLAAGSGFFLESGGTAVTNYHVIAGAFSAKIRLSGGAEYPVAGVLAYDIEKDLALLKISGSAFPALTVGDSSALRSGQTVYTIGSPMGLENTISQGIVSSPRRADYNGMIQISAPISHGSSGGALLTADGSVAGITTAGIESGQNLNFAIPISAVSSLSRSSLQTLAQVARAADRYAYEHRADAFDNNVDETEPNDTLSQAGFLENGVSVWGVIDDEEPDLFLFRCNTKGTVEVSLFSDSSGYLVRDLDMFLAPLGSGDYVLAEYRDLDDGSVCLYLEYTVTGPGVFVLGLLSDRLAQYYDLDTDYAFYYEFIPE